jgi:uncharacterized protein (TIGR02391 family)
MTMSAPWPDGREILELPVDSLAMHVLWFLADQPNARPTRRQSFIQERTSQVANTQRDRGAGAMVSESHADLRSQPDVAWALSEAWEWLVTEGLIALDPVAIGISVQAIPDTYFVTRWGRELAAAGTEGLDISRARRRLGVDLHPDLAGPLGKLTQIGAFEQAAFTALREIEQRVRSMAGEPKGKSGGTLRGEALMTEAFKPGGILADPEAELAEQQGQMNLFRGAFAAFRNPLGHTSIEFEDPIEAAVVVLLADLPMRQLDHVADRRRESEPAT